MNDIMQRIVAAAAAAAVSYLSQRLGPEAGSIGTAVAAYVVAHIFHNKAVPGAPTSNIGDP